jgi:hypothetical protein
MSHIMARESVLQTLRAALFATLCLAVGAGVQRTMSADAIPAWALVVGGIGGYLPARYAVVRAERGLFGIAALMGGQQIGLHLLFCCAQQAASTSMPGISMACASMAETPSCTTSTTGMRAGMTMPGVQGASGTGSGLTGSGLKSAAFDHLSVGTLLGPALAALACAWWLRRGEAALYALIRGAALRLRAVYAVVMILVPPVDRRPRAARVSSRPRILRSLWLRGEIARRGPPRAPAYL